jgi:hypothetical protein
VWDPAICCTDPQLFFGRQQSQETRSAERRLQGTNSFKNTWRLSWYSLLSCVLEGAEALGLVVMAPEFLGQGAMLLL